MTQLQQINDDDLQDIISILNPARGHNTCVGYAPTPRRRCENRVNRADVGQAYYLTSTIGKVIQEGGDLEELLYEIAERTLCRQVHRREQHQHDSLVQQWAAAINKLSGYPDGAMSINMKLQTEPSVTREPVVKQEPIIKEDTTIQQEPIIKSEPLIKSEPQATAIQENIKHDESIALIKEVDKKIVKMEQHLEDISKKLLNVEQAQPAQHQKDLPSQDKKSPPRQESPIPCKRQTRSATRRQREQKEYETAWSFYSDYDLDSDVSDEAAEELINWPVKSGSWQDVTIPNIRAFFNHAPVEGDERLAFLKKQLKRWRKPKLTSQNALDLQMSVLLTLGTMVNELLVEEGESTVSMSGHYRESGDASHFDISFMATL